ncbi:aminotriazole resistance, partial [Fusarium pseudocircinatum]
MDRSFDITTDTGAASIHGGIIPLEPLNPKAKLRTANQVNSTNDSDAQLNPPAPEEQNAPRAQDSSGLGISKTRGVIVIVTLAGISFLNTMGSGILIAALPKIAADVGLSENLILWPAAVYALAAGCLLLIFGAIADAVGAKL